MKKTKKFHRLVGGVLAAVFPFQYLMIGTGSFIAQAQLLDQQIPSSFSYKTDTLKNLRSLNLASFFGRPVKIPFDSKNPEQIPGGDRDFAIIFPPRVLDKNVSVPLRAIYFSSGKEIAPENAQFVQNIEKYVNSVVVNNSTLVEILKNLIENQAQLSISTDNCSGLACYLPAILKMARAEDTLDSTSLDLSSENPILTSDDMSQLTDSLKDMDTSNPQVKQLLVLVLLLIMVNQSMAQSLNSDKQNCLDLGGEWINGTCESEAKTVCEDNGGTYKKFTNSCLKDKQVCGNEENQCSGTADDSTDPLDLYGCACKSGSCLDDNGNCVAKNNSKKKLCENSGGTWREFFDAEELCQQKCGASSAACTGASFSSSSSSGSIMGCDCTAAEGNDNMSKWNTGGTTAPNKCLADTGKCIDRDTSKDDDDKDNVPNSQDRCPNSTPDGSGTVNMQPGSQYMGCTCSQIQAMGGLRPQQQQQCPADGCEANSPYMVRYDRSVMQNQQNQQLLCQNGIPQQQQQQQQQQYYNQQSGQYSNCPVIFRQFDQQCQDELDRRNNNDNLNKKLDDLLKQLQDKNKNKGNQGNNQGGPNNNGGPPPNNGNPNQNDNKDKVPEKGKMSPAIDPKGVGEANAPQDGTSAKPYYLHASQFTKVCGENTYVLTNASATAGDFKNDPSKAGQVTPGSKPLNDLISSLSKLTTCGPNGSGCPDPKELPNLSPKVGEAKQIMSQQWSKLSQEQQQNIINILNGGGSGTDRLNKARNAFDEAVKTNGSKAQQAAQAAQSNGKGAKSMKDLQEKNETYFKVPKCEELAANHCCVCSCCDKSKKDCGWSIGKECKDGKCTGQNCDKESCDKCKPPEDPAKSIQLVMGNKIPGDLKQADNKCYEINHDKKETSTNLCKNYKDPTHVGICRYDCEGNEKGCETERDNCKIIVQTQDQHNLEFSLKENTSDKNQPKPDATVVKFTNRDDGSVIKGTQGSGSDWMKKLKDERGKACNCGEEPKNADGSDGLAGPVGQQQTQGQGQWERTGDTEGLSRVRPGDIPEKPQGTLPTQAPTTPQQGSTGPDYGRGGENGALDLEKIPQQKVDEMRNNDNLFGDYYNNKNRSYPATWGDWNDYRQYREWLGDQSWIYRLLNSDNSGYKYWKDNFKRR